MSLINCLCCTGLLFVPSLVLDSQPWKHATVADTFHHGLWTQTETMAGSVDIWHFSRSFPGKDWLIWGSCITPGFPPSFLVTYFLLLSVSLSLIQAFLDSFGWTLSTFCHRSPPKGLCGRIRPPPPFSSCWALVAHQIWPQCLFLLGDLLILQ